MLRANKKNKKIECTEGFDSGELALLQDPKFESPDYCNSGIDQKYHLFCEKYDDFKELKKFHKPVDPTKRNITLMHIASVGIENPALLIEILDGKIIKNLSWKSILINC